MNKESYEFLRAMEETPSPSGFEQPVQRIVRRRMKAIADTIETDVHGNVIVGLNPKGTPRVMLAGHCDQIGMMVRYISDQGFLSFAPIGGIDAQLLPGLRVTVHGGRKPVNGVIGRKPIHLMRDKPNEPAKIDMNDLVIDIGAKNKADATKRVSVGDPVTFQLGMSPLNGDLVVSPGFDNKVGTFVVMEALRLAAAKKIRCALFAVSTVQEEIGLRGSRTSCFGIDPLVGIAVDVTHASDYPGVEKKDVGEITLGRGPVIERGANINPKVHELLVQTAKRKRIGHQLSAAPGATGTDANAIQISRAGVAAGLVSIPNRYMHTPVEVVSLADLEAAAKLIAETIAQIDGKTNFIPQ
ncbi:MAG: M42 family metallopeptidase [Phycisphaerae bacterium]|nr:M42 family metallopeptidase [Phycisphaerae bacterium]